MTVDASILEKIGMSYEQAEDIVHSVVVNRIRWGKMYDGSDIGFKKLCDALVVYAHSDNKKEAELRDSLTRSNRQLAAALAREARWKKKLAELTGQPIEDEAGE